ncbi:transcriptional regulator, partial [Burkholderia sp. HI2500]
MDIDPTFGVFFMSKYTEQFKVSIAEEYESGHAGFRE